MTATASLPVERIRFSAERDAAVVCRSDPFFAARITQAETLGPPDVGRLRRQLLARSVQLTDGMAPDAWAAARRAADALGVSGDLEIYQAAGAENAAIHLVSDPILLEIRGRMLSLVDYDAAVAIFGHELGHWLAHGPSSPDGIVGMVCTGAAHGGFGIPDSARRCASHLAMCRELTADRFGLLATRDLDAALRLEMAGATGLAVGDLTWDTSAYLAQCTALIEGLEADGGAIAGDTHPEHGLRAWALSLWSQSDVYLELTGGTGGIPAAEIDARIAKVMSATTPGEPSLMGVDPNPMPEVMECALASCVLVALCDGELAEEEAVAIENLFASHVTDWQRYLNWDNALEAFADTGAVVVHGGPSVQRSVFQIVVQVLTADGVVKPAEIEMVCAIGDALRCGVLFRALLTPVLHSLGVEVPDLSAVTRTIPMPARVDEAREAFDLFLRGMVRRGGGQTTVRRMSRLLGDRDGTAITREWIAERFAALDLHAGVDLADVPLDQLLYVELGEEARAAQAESHLPVDATVDEPARKRLTIAITRLRDQLVDGDGRSPSIRLRRCRTGRSFDIARLDGVSVGQAERVLATVREQARARLVDGAEVGVHEGAEKVAKDLVALQREAQARTEQTGARDLYVGAPFLTGVFAGYLVRAPLVLFPVELERTSGRAVYAVPRPGEPPVANQALFRLLFAKKNLPFPDELAAELDTAAEKGLDAVRGVLSDHGLMARPETDALTPLVVRDEEFADWADGRAVLERCAVLGFFPQSSSDMIQDYDGLLEAIADPSVALGERFGAAGALLPAELRAAFEVTAELDGSDDAMVPVVPADPSQLEVLHQARSRRALVVDGPPGTGKSQVIVNLVADALARGQSVAVVCEKRAAIDVVAQRLGAVGLSHLLAVVHDVHEDRRRLYDHVVSRLNEGLVRDADPNEAERVSEELAQVRASLHARREALAASLGDTAPTLGQLHVLSTSYLTPPLAPMPASLARLSLLDARRLAERVSRESRNADLFEVDSVWRAPAGSDRPSLAEADPQTLAQVEDALVASRETAVALDALRGEQDVDDRAVAAARPALMAVQDTAEARAQTGVARLLQAAMTRSEEPGVASAVQAVADTWSDASLWLPTVPERVRFEAPPDLSQALATIRRVGGSFFRFFYPSWWSARSRIRSILSSQWPSAAGAAVTPALATQIDHRVAGAGAYKALDSALSALGIQATLPNTEAATAQAQALTTAWTVVSDLSAHRAALQAADAWPDAVDGWDALITGRLALADASDAHAQATAPVRTWLPWTRETPSADEVERMLTAWSLDAGRVVLSDRNLDAASSVHPGARSFVHALADGDLDGLAEWREAVEHGWVSVVLDATERRTPGVRTLQRDTPFGSVPETEARLKELHQARAQVHIDAILQQRDRVDLLTEARPEKGKRRTPLQKAREQMLREASKKRYVLSLRGFVRQFADAGLMDILPVWLVSPETMAILFPGRPVFDLVVMDEASQATVEKGLPALVRGHRAVIAGDERQMPPTSYFKLATPGEEDTIGTAETVANDVLSAESLLVLARERCTHRGLRWHYRCLHEELIAFSNHAMYGGDLFTIPSPNTPHAPPAVEWVSVEDGAYDRGVNPIEAERVTDIVSELLAESPELSIGVVTFNVQQRRLILDTLDARAESDPAFGERWAEARSLDAVENRPFVKNLEGVQGDERDVIVFSLGHAPSVRRSGPLAGQPYVAARFGPLGQEGGERRLNVAVSRAKQRCIVVASFTPSMLSVANTKNEGPKLFKAFLEYVWDMTHGRRRAAEKTLERVQHGSLGAVREARRLDLGVASLGAQIGLALTERDIAHDLNVGSSGFRVPLALRDPDDPTAWRVAVLTEEGHDVGDVDEHHHHEPGVLRARDWHVIRVDARRWHREPEAVLDALQSALEASCLEAVAERQRRARAALEEI